MHIYAYGAARSGISNVNRQSSSFNGSTRCPVAGIPATSHDQNRPSSYPVIRNGSQMPAAVLTFPSVPFLINLFSHSTAETEGPHWAHMSVSVIISHIRPQEDENERLTSARDNDILNNRSSPLTDYLSTERCNVNEYLICM